MYRRKTILFYFIVASYAIFRVIKIQLFNIPMMHVYKIKYIFLMVTPHDIGLKRLTKLL